MDPAIPPHEMATTLRPLVYGAALAVMFTMRPAEPVADGSAPAEPTEPVVAPRRRRRFRHRIGEPPESK